MKKDVLVIGAAILDILARPTSESVFESGSYACDDIKISFGGDALNDAILLSKMGKSVELISVIGNDKEGHIYGYSIYQKMPTGRLEEVREKYATNFDEL